MHFYSDIPLRRTISALIELGFSDRTKKKPIEFCRVLPAAAAAPCRTWCYIICSTEKQPTSFLRLVEVFESSRSFTARDNNNIISVDACTAVARVGKFFATTKEFGMGLWTRKNALVHARARNGTLHSGFFFFLYIFGAAYIWRTANWKPIVVHLRPCIVCQSRSRARKLVSIDSKFTIARDLGSAIRRRDRSNEKMTK